MLKKIDYRSFSFWVTVILVLGVALIIYLPEGLKNTVDPYCMRLDTLLYANGIEKPDGNKLKLTENELKLYRIEPVSEHYADLKNIYDSLHTGNSDIESFDSIMLKPFPLLDDYKSFNKSLKTFLKEKKLVVQGVTGAGKTTLVDRITRIIAGKRENILKLECVEKMEVEYHKEYIGRKRNGVFKPGKFLKLLTAAQNNPRENFIFIIDDIDKIFPATLFGSKVWKELDNPDYETYIEGYPHEIYFPPNFYMISITHSGVGNVIEMTAEHFRRLGDLYFLPPNDKVFLLYLKTVREKYDLDYYRIRKLLYSFKEINELIREKYGRGYMLGQWATIRKLLKAEDYDKFINSFISHVNAFKPAKAMTHEDLDDIFYAVEHNGELPGTNDFAVLYQSLLDTGIFSELSVGLLFAIISGLTGWTIYRRKKRFLRRLNNRILTIINDYEEKKIEFNEAIDSILQHKDFIKSQVEKGKIKYEEYIFFVYFIDEAIKKIEETQKVFDVTESFDKTFDEFMQDGVLDDHEYDILIKFLRNMKTALPPEVYYPIQRRINEAHRQSAK